MPRHRRGDFNQTAFQVVPEPTGQTPKLEDDPEPVKNPAAVALEGGRARAARFSPRKRSQAAAKAARARWKNS